ncbi:MAG: DNA-binding protein AraC-type [Anaerocolumna sp.]|jgi:mannose-6-phosphate isomerase-like protein (cupin superfamily)|nr:DNA-binding protein AraC-type [Anaerocolumna sp.]
MKQETRTVKYDSRLKVEAYHFQGIMQKFPNHFHEYYVIGFIEKGKRYLSCKNKEYTVEPGDFVIFNPLDNHTCEQIDGKTLDYRCINIQPEVMSKAVYEITGKEFMPYFTSQVIFHSDLVPLLTELHQMVMQEETDFRKEELFLFLLEQLM